MKAKAWLKLQNGSDIRGVALDGIKGEEVNLTFDVARTLGWAFAAWLDNKQGPEKQEAMPPPKGTVAVGTDSRISGRALKKGFSEGLSLGGYEVLDVGLASTPALFMSTRFESSSALAGVMLTASHLPFNRNGFKFFTCDGGLNKQDIRDILNRAIELDRPSGPGKAPEASAQQEAGSSRDHDLMKEYAAFLVDYIREGAADPEDPDQPLKGMKIIVDAGNGAGGFFVDRVLTPLGADTSGSQFLNPDGRFPNHIPNPEDPDAMASISEAVVRHRADLGVIFDTDVDRSALVNRRGEALNRNRLIALVSAIVLEEHPGSTIVTDSITSVGLGQFIRQAGGRHHRFRRGYRNVINESQRLNVSGEESWLAIETSGHAALKENFFLDDGAFLVAKLLVRAARLRRQGRDLDEEISGLSEAAHGKEYRLKIRVKDFRAYGRKVLTDLEERISKEESWEREQPDHEGIRANFLAKEGWFLLRLSLHDPVMVLNLEANEQENLEEMRRWLISFLRGYSGLDSSMK